MPAIPLLILLISATTLHARQPEIGARPLGMGEAFIAVADDGNALLWNPAGLPRLGQHEIIASSADLYGVGHTSNLGYTLPIKGRHAAGFDWNHLGSEEAGLDFSQDSFRFSYGYEPGYGLSLGTALRRIGTNMVLDRVSLSRGTGWSWDIGALYTHSDQLRMGMVIRDLGDAEVLYKQRGKADVITEQRLRVGIALKPLDHLILAADLDDRLHMGAEYWYRDLLALRSGLQHDFTEGEGITLSCGLGLRYQLLTVDAAYVIPPTLPADFRFSLGFHFNLRTSKVRVVSPPTIDHIFPAFRHHYASNDSIAHLQLLNRDRRPHQTTLRFFIPEFMEAPAEQRMVMLPKEKKIVPIGHIIFADALTRLVHPKYTDVEIEVSYQSDQSTRRHAQNASVFVYGRNHMQWDDMRKAAAFIRYDAPAVDAFSRTALANFTDVAASMGRPGHNVLRAMVLFEALRQLGIRYAVDANSPYNQMRADTEVVDHINYPSETLQKGTGDCDDLTVLYAALLENAGLHTALVDDPGHIFLLFDAGISRRQAQLLPIDPQLYVQRGDRLWIPVEVTLIEQGFLAAWREGAKRLGQWDRNALLHGIYNTAEAWHTYRPAAPSIEIQVEGPHRSDYAPQISDEYGRFQDMVSQHLNTVYLDVLATQSGHISLRHTLARVYTALQSYDYALEQYQQILQSEGESSKTLNNMGIIYFAQGDIATATRLFKRAHELQPENTAIKRNYERVLQGGQQATKVDHRLKSNAVEWVDERFMWIDR